MDPLFAIGFLAMVALALFLGGYAMFHEVTRR